MKAMYLRLSIDYAAIQEHEGLDAVRIELAPCISLMIALNPLIRDDPNSPAVMAPPRQKCLVCASALPEDPVIGRASRLREAYHLSPSSSPSDRAPFLRHA